MNFVAIDFETATSLWTSVCSIGICVVENNRIKEQKEILIKPQPYEFNDFNIKIHGITPKMVADRYTFDKYWNEIKSYIDGKLVIAHNASFDINVLKRTLDMFSLEYPIFDYLCTVKLSQKAYPEFECHKLNYLCDAFDVKFKHHCASDDAYGCAMVMLKILKDYHADSVSDLEQIFGVKIGKVYPGCTNFKTKREKQKK